MLVYQLVGYMTTNNVGHSHEGNRKHLCGAPLNVSNITNPMMSKRMENRLSK